MKVAVRFSDDALAVAAIRITRSWWERRLIGRAVVEDVAIAVLAVNGERRWFLDSSGRPVSDAAVIAALERERGRAEREPRVAAALS